MKNRQHADLPGVLAEIAEVTDRATALLIAGACGGARQYFPARVSDDHWLPKLIGRARADQLCAHFRSTANGGIEITIPLGPAGSRARLHQAIDAMQAEGASVDQIARTLCIDRSTIQRRNARLGKPQAGDARQGRLL